jgi:hypothetical protein
MKTSDPIKSLKIQEQVQYLDKPGSLRKYAVVDQFPPADKTCYQIEEDNFEKYKKIKINGKNEIEEGFLPSEITKVIEIPDSIPPGQIFQGTKFVRNTYSKIKEEPVYVPSSPKSEFDKTSGYTGTPYNNSSRRTKRRFRRRANQINRTYFCPLNTCRKSYGSEGSLNQHMKIKHPEYYHTAEMPGRRRGRMGGRPLIFAGMMQPPSPLGHYRQYMGFNK